MTGNRAPGTSWFMRRFGPDATTNGYVRTTDDDMIQVVFEDESKWLTALHLSRADARLLAKRINQCLDGTVKR